jgi:hypothetical protein
MMILPLVFFGSVDAHCFRLHMRNPLDEDEMKFMYAPGQEGNAGTTNGLYTFLLSPEHAL